MEKFYLKFFFLKKHIYKKLFINIFMLRRNHFTWTFFISLFIYHLYFNYTISNTLILSYLTATISWLPDIDFKVIDALKTFEKKTLFIVKPITFFLKLLFKHRGITHSIFLPVFILFLAEFSFVDNLLIQTILRIFYIALFLHIFEDSLTIRGIKPFFPIPFGTIKFKIVNTGNAIHFILLELIAYLMMINFYLFYIL